MQVVSAMILSFLLHLLIFGVNSHWFIPAGDHSEGGMTVGYIERTVKSFRTVEPGVHHEQLNRARQKRKKTEEIKNSEQNKSVVNVVRKVKEKNVVEDLISRDESERPYKIQSESETAPEQQIDVALKNGFSELEDAVAVSSVGETEIINQPDKMLFEGAAETVKEGDDQAGGQAFSAVEVSQSAVPRYDINPRPEYPLVARKRGWEGVVLLEILVLENGRVGEIEMLTSSGYRSLDTAAKKVVRRWKFIPASVLGGAVESQVQVPIRFSLQVP